MIYNYHHLLVLCNSQIPKNDREKIEMNSLEEILAENLKLTIKKETILHCTNKSCVNMKIRRPLTRKENINENPISIFFLQEPRSLETGVIRFGFDQCFDAP